MPVPTRVLAAAQPLFEGEAELVVAQGADGELGILPQHAPLVTWLKPGELMVRQGGQDRHFFLEAAVLEVLPDRVTVLAESGQLSEQLDPERAETARREAEEALSRGEPAPDQLEGLRRRLEVAERRLQAAERSRRRQRS
ncbi:MAG: ATP synthase F1 subunit epsilon [Candidatus Dormibacteria bacterium]